MRIMRRDREVMKRLAAARWLTTSQIAALCFPSLSMEMPRRRLRLLRKNRYVISRQNNLMAAAWHSLGPLGREVVLAHGWNRPIQLQRSLPRNLEHFMGINEIRVFVEIKAKQGEFEVGFFYASWELQQLGWTARIIPDAACHLAHAGMEQTIFFEYDRGGESPGYIMRTKLDCYEGGLPGFGFSRVVIIVETKGRLAQLHRFAVCHPAKEQIRVMLRQELFKVNSIVDILS